MKVRLKVVSGNPEVRRAEQQVMQRELEVAELEQQLIEARERLKEASQRAAIMKHKKTVRLLGKKPHKQTVDPLAKLVYYSRVFEETPTKKTAKASLEVARKVERWDGVALTGLFLEQYAARYARDWRGTTNGLVELAKALTRLCDRVGDESELAILAVFSPKMKWVDNQLGLLSGVDAYERFIVPAIDALRKDRRGEGSEWTGTRDAESGCEEVDL